jgi:hypothetical protein
MRKYLWLILLLWLPVQADATVLFCASLDSTTDTDVPAGVSTATETGSIDNVVYKYGGGSFKNSAGPSLTLDWNPLVTTALPSGDTGSIGLWVRIGATDSDWKIELEAAVGADKHTILVYGNGDSGGNPNKIGMSMKDKDGTTIMGLVQANFTWAINTWYYIEHNWEWNIASGTTELSIDGVVKVTSELGDAETRAGASNPNDRVTFNIPSNLGNVDDITISDAVCHVGNFTPPTVARCPVGVEQCDIGVANWMHFGSPFSHGFNRGLGN